MKTFLITFVTLDGNVNQIYIDATNKEKAILKFEAEYSGSIKYCDELTTN